METPVMEERSRILIIDDDQVDRRAISRALRGSGLPVDLNEASSIAAAWERIADGPWDCIFLDYLLPGGDGLELLKQFRDHGYDMPIVVVTSHGDEKVAVELMKAGVSDYVNKGLLNAESVGHILRSAMRTHRAEAERRITAQALADSEARLSEAQRIANIGSWETDAATLEEFWTDQVFAILGETSTGNGKMGRRTLKHHILPEDLASCIVAYEEIMRYQQARKVDVRIRAKSGEIKQVELQGKPILGPDGKILKIIGTIQDISPRKAIEEALSVAKDLAERNAKAKQEFLANMSHEIRTPMNAILGFTKLLQDSKLDARQQEYLHAIDTSGEALLSIINDILDLSKVEAGMMRFEQQPFCISSTLQSLQHIFGAATAEKKLQLTLLRGPGVPDWVVGDAFRLRQVLLNLVSNALKFTSEGEINVEIKVVEESDAAVKLLFEVADTGIGIDPEQQKFIFDSFTQASSDTTRKYGGTGLGLTISKRIVELQGGRIGVDSELGQGSNFFFELQFALATASQVSSAQLGAQQSKQQSPAMLKVLLAEDNPLNQRLATIVLEKLGYQYVVAGNGVEVLAMMERERPDVVLMDIQMPEMDGYEATRRIRKLSDPQLAAVPVIALTAHALVEEVDKSKLAGMNAFISKPFQADVLQATILKLTAGTQDGSVPDASVDSSTPLSDPLTQQLDLSVLHEITGGDNEIRKELTEIFLQEVPKALEKMQQAVDQGTGMSLYQAAHAIKPSLVLFGVPHARELLKVLEDAEGLDRPGEDQQTAFAQLQVHARSACAFLSA